VFDDAAEHAWEFVWDYMTIAMTQCLEEVGSMVVLVRDSWDSIMESKTAEQGQMFQDVSSAVIASLSSIE